MFVRTERLTLRPGWPEDAPEVARAIGHEMVVSKLATAPWPYALGDAEAFLGKWHERKTPFFLICEHEAGQARVIGGIGISPDMNGDPELGYWLTPSAWGRGYATEAGRAVVRTARETLRMKRLVSSHFTDNPASGRVLRKIGFRPTGRIVPRHSEARGRETPCALFELDLDDCGGCADPERMAA